MADKPRILNNSRDMIMSLLVLLALIAVVVVSSRNCSIGLQGNASDDKRPAFDVQAALRVDASTMPFPIRQPDLPSTWRPTSGSNGLVGDSPVSTVGWITPTGYYLALSQTNASETALLPTLNPNRDKDGELSGTGSRDIDGRKWVTYVTGDRLAPDHGVRKAWISDFGQVRIGLSGKADEADFTALAQAVAQATPIPSGRR